MSSIGPNLFLNNFAQINFIHTQISSNKQKIAIDPYELQIR